MTGSETARSDAGEIGYTPIEQAVSMRRWQMILSVMLTGILWSACGAPAATAPAPTATTSPWLARFSENGVTVEIELRLDASGESQLAATFTPELQGYHLYSNKLPRGGVNGQGRPTLLEIPAQEALRPAGDLVASQPTVLEPPALLVFPAGPVTLTLPIERTQGRAEAQLSVTYLACDPLTCLTPVIDKHISVVLP
jgi:hypothetical protein